MPNGTNSFLLQSLFAQDGVNDPAAPNMDTGLAAVVQDVGVGASSVFQGIAEDRHPIKSAVVVDGLGEGYNGGTEPCRMKGNRTKMLLHSKSVRGSIEVPDYHNFEKKTTAYKRIRDTFITIQLARSSPH